MSVRERYTTSWRGPSYVPVANAACEVDTRSPPFGRHDRATGAATTDTTVDVAMLPSLRSDFSGDLLPSALTPTPPSPPDPPPPAHPLGGRACYFVLGAGLMAAWNALITATDYFEAVYPGWHTDRLFTVSYLPVCLVFLAVGIRYPDLPPPPVRIRLGYAGFTVAMATVPLLDAWLVARAGSGGGAGTAVEDAAAGGAGAAAAVAAAPAGGLVSVLLCVALVGACDGLCQGAVFGEVARLPPPYTHALVSGTASSGLLVCILRLASKASFEVVVAAAGAGPDDAARGLRDGTRLYFALAGLLSLSCLIVYDVVLPRLRLQPLDGHLRRAAAAARSDGGGGCFPDHSSEQLYEQMYEHQALLLPPPLELSRECRSGSADTSGGGRTAGDDSDADDGRRRADLNRGGFVLSAAAGADDHGGGDCDIGSATTSSKRADCGGIGDAGGHERAARAQAQLPNAVNVERNGNAGGISGGDPYGISISVSGSYGTGGSSCGGGVWAQVRRCLAACWPLCGCLFVTYAVTLSIFPGFLAEDIHSSQLGDWYPLLLITAFNLADLVGKSMPCLEPLQGPELFVVSEPLLEKEPLMVPEPRLGPEPLTGKGCSARSGSSGVDSGGGMRGGGGRLGRGCNRVLAAALRPLRRPRGLLAAAAVRGAAALPAFLAAARLGAPAWGMAALTAALGVSNGYLTAQALTMGPTAVPEPPPPPSRPRPPRPPKPQPASRAQALMTPCNDEDDGGAAADRGGSGSAADGGCAYQPLPAAETRARETAETAPGGARPGPTGSRTSPSASPSSFAVPQSGQLHHSDGEVAETLLVLSLVAGLNAGAYAGWLWLL